MKRVVTLFFIIIILATSSCHSTNPSQVRGDFLAANSQDSTENLQTPLPESNGFVNDFANILDEQTEQQLERTLSDFKNRAKIDFVVVTVNTTGGRPIFDYSLAVARGWAVGARNPDKAGLLMLIAIDDRKWHVQISRALEKTLSNEEVGQLGGLLNAPFREKRYGEGVIQCVHAFIKTLSERRGSS
ncbi:MAG TPA: TPM domain-containing protein [Pyrinomonadaceae bacterium]|nr:TPM domain-containing protein [Pyrinomonadaceae bacterium]